MAHPPPLYSWLDTSKREIRLLRLSPLSGTQCQQGYIVGTLAVFCLESCPEYDALSYAWGPTTIATKVTVNDHQVSVAPNLYDALRTVQLETERFIWIDAICINQRDYAERACQVVLMREVFSRAKTVHIWLGHEYKSTSRVLNVLGRAGRRLEPDFEDPESLPKEINNLSVDELKHVFANGWWDRLWVVQEASLALNALAHIGTKSIAFNRLLMGILAAFRLRSQDSEPLPGYMSRLATKFAAPVLAHQSEAAHMKLIPDVLAAVRGSKVSVRHDRIYGILGLLPQQLAIQPDYTKSLESVFQDFTMRVIECERSLDILALGGIHTNKALRLPSWVPNYELSSPYLFRGTSGFDASKALALQKQTAYPSVTCDVDGAHLTVWAHIIDSIAFADLVVPETVSLQTLDEDQAPRNASIDRFQQRLCECAVKLRATRPAHETVRDSIIALWDIIQGQVGGHSTDRSIFLQEQFISWLFLQTDDKYSPRHYPVIRSLLAGAFCHFFATQSTRVAGLVSGQAVAGDTVAILAGASTPCILREVQKDGRKAYRYVGHAYCLGVMQGEAISGAALAMNGSESDMSGVFKTITLV